MFLKILINKIICIIILFTKDFSPKISTVGKFLRLKMINSIVDFIYCLSYINLFSKILGEYIPSTNIEICTLFIHYNMIIFNHRYFSQKEKIQYSAYNLFQQKNSKNMRRLKLRMQNIIANLHTFLSQMGPLPTFIVAYIPLVFEFSFFLAPKSLKIDFFGILE